MKLPWLTEGQKFGIGGTIIFAGFVIFFLFFGPAGCATVFDAPTPQYDWNQPKSPPLKNTVVIETAKAPEICRSMYPTARAGLQGCVKRDYEADLCVIFVIPNPPDELIWHEKVKHCINGENHS